MVDRASRTASQTQAGGPEHFVQAATRLAASPVQTASWGGVHLQQHRLPPGGWSHPGSTFIRITVPLAQPGRVRRRLPGESAVWLPGVKRQGTISITPPAAEGEWEWLDRSDFGLLFLPARLLTDAIDDAGLHPGRLSLRPVFAEPDEVVGPVFRTMVGEAGREGRQSRLLVSSAAVFLSQHLLRRYAAPEQDHGAGNGSLDDARLRRVIDAVEAALGHDWSIDEMAREAGLSPGRFAHAFRDKLGRSPRSFVQQRRLACAKKMLAGGVLPISQVAAHCGFESQAWFTTCFKQTYGVTPAAYRRLIG